MQSSNITDISKVHATSSSEKIKLYFFLQGMQPTTLSQTQKNNKFDK